jgi:hypothetical protein
VDTINETQTNLEIKTMTTKKAFSGFEQIKPSINVTQSGQGLLSVVLDGKPTNYKIANRGGKWTAYGSAGDFKSDVDLARLIHHPEQLSAKLKEILPFC